MPPLFRITVVMGMPARADVSMSRPDMPKAAEARHHIEAEFVGVGEFGADHQRDAKAQMGCFAPADVTVGCGCGVKWHD